VVRYPAVLLLLFSAGCASLTPPQPQVAATQPAPQAAATQPATAQPATKPADTVVAAATPEPPASQPVASEPAAKPVITSAPQAVGAPPPPPNVKAPVPQAVRKDAATVTPTPKPAAPAVARSPAATAAPTGPPTTAPTATPTLDLEALKARLRATKAIGVFTKISLKNKVDDLMKQFTAHHQGNKPPIAELRLSYDLLMMKVLSLLQDGDETLASAVVSSREAIWALLANQKTFAALQS